jgi:hypothetical protein
MQFTKEIRHCCFQNIASSDCCKFYKLHSDKQCNSWNGGWDHRHCGHGTASKGTWQTVSQVGTEPVITVCSVPGHCNFGSVVVTLFVVHYRYRWEYLSWNNTGVSKLMSRLLFWLWSTQLVVALCYKLEGHMFDSWWFQSYINLTLPATLWP